MTHGKASPLSSEHSEVAWLTFEEKDKGSIEPGKLADLAVLTKDYATCPEDEIKDIEVLRTVVGGKVVYDKLP